MQFFSLQNDTVIHLFNRSLASTLNYATVRHIVKSTEKHKEVLTKMFQFCNIAVNVAILKKGKTSFY